MSWARRAAVLAALAGMALSVVGAVCTFAGAGRLGLGIQLVAIALAGSSVTVATAQLRQSERRARLALAGLENVLTGRPLGAIEGRTFRAGDHVSIGYGGRKVAGKVRLASPNGRSLILEFDGVLGGFAGAMFVRQLDDGTFQEIKREHGIDIEPVPAYTCPSCGHVSYNANDIGNRYCGACHKFEANT